MYTVNVTMAVLAAYLISCAWMEVDLGIASVLTSECVSFNDQANDLPQQRQVHAFIL